MPNELRTPHLLHVIPTFVPAGIEMRTVNLIAGFGDDFRHSILSMDGRTDAMDRLPAGAPVRLLSTPEKAGSLRTAARLRQILREEKPDLLLTYNWGAFDALLAARSLGFRRVVHHEDGFNAEEAHSFKRRRVLARRAVLPGVPRLILPSNRLRDIATQLWKVPADRIRLVRNGIRLDVFIPGRTDPELRRELGIPQEALVVGAVGHLRGEKNFVRLLDACAAAGPDRSPELPLHVLLVGDGEERARIEERAARPDLQGRIHLAGYRADVHRLYRAMDLFAITSDTEQMPVCLLEAMASGLPVASTDVGDIKAVLPAEQERWMVPLGPDEATTVTALGARLAGLARDPETRQRLGALNRRRVEERFSFEAMLAAYREIYHEVLCLPDTPGLPAEEVVGVC
jgi:glycosyltransferase involved in cell wall biosynthesis